MSKSSGLELGGGRLLNINVENVPYVQCLLYYWPNYFSLSLLLYIQRLGPSLSVSGRKIEWCISKPEHN